jgi:hypothetical protein
MKKTVFISSTYEDLKEYRKAVWELLENYDVNIKGMEQFGARSESALQTCLNEVERSDIYVGIIGFKLGSIEKQTAKSFTRVEYEKALKEGKEILIYLINDDAEISAKHIDFGEKHEKLENFKKLLKEKHTVDFFRSERNLTEKLDRRFDDLLSSKEEKKETEEENPHKAAKKIINKFVLAPNIYTDREVTLDIKFKGSPYALSKELCNNFNLRYGRTIGVAIEIIKPEEITPDLENIIIEEKYIEDYFEIDLDKEFKITAKLNFTTKNIGKERANFFDYTHSYMVENPNYDPTYPATDNLAVSTILNTGWSTRTVMGEKYNPRYIKKSEYIEGEGKIILLLQEFQSL